MKAASRFLTHYATAVWLLFAAYMLAYEYGPVYWPFWYGLPLLILLLITGVGQIIHSRLLCSRCVKAIPVNGSEMAEKRELSLRLFHFSANILLNIAVLLALVLFSWHWLLLWFAAQSVLEMRHRRVRLWCPQCRNGGQGVTVEMSPKVPEGTQL